MVGHNREKAMGGDKWDGKDFYAVLHVHPLADDAAIRAAYRRLSKDLHPDIRGVSTDGEEMQQLNAAYYVLTRRRKEYDDYRNATEIRDTNPTLHGDNWQPETEARRRSPRWEERIRVVEEEVNRWVFGCGIVFIVAALGLCLLAVLVALLLHI